ncbi:MAG: hypothetical protein A2Y38_22165 [Spirochaetes bacterium GWB1_59_5]|nr:MAG: hypothetical protein A2Y38_22165 [Spirochaetes bacterium GWB1_59_5]
MSMTMIIVGGIVVVTLIAVVGDYLSKAKQTADPSAIRELKDRIAALEREASERDAKLSRMEGEIAFTTKLLEDRHDTGH